MTRISRHGLWTLLFLTVLPLACGGGSGPKPVDLNYPKDLPVTEVDAVEDMQGESTRDNPLPESIVQDHQYEILLLLDTSEAIEILPNKDLKVRAKVWDRTASLPGAGIPVLFDIVEVKTLQGDPVGDYDGSFSSGMVDANEEGLVDSVFRAGESCDLVYTLQLSLAEGEAQPVAFDVTVRCVACGCANLSFTVEGGLNKNDLRDVNVYVLPEDYHCTDLTGVYGVPEEVVLYERNVASVDSQATFECIPADTWYTVYAEGHRAGSPCVVTTGCNDSVFLQPEVCRDYTVKMYLATMNPAGQYDCIDHFDFSNMVKQCAGGDTTIIQCATGATGDLGRTVCCVLSEMIKFFETPGLTIIETIQDLASQWIGSLIVDTLFNLFKDAVANVLTQWLLNNSPAFIQDFFKIGGDMMGAITNLEMMSDLTLKKLNNDLTVRGDQYWHGLALYWKFGCDPHAPDYEQCGRIPLDLESLDDPLFPTDLLGGNFTANIVPFDSFVVNLHSIKLNYGKLVLYVLNEIIIKGITGGKAHTLLEVAHLWIDCKSVSQGILGQIAEWFGGSQGDIEGICNTAVDFLFGFVNTFVNALSLDTEMSISGTAKLVDDDCDMKTDFITRGKNNGYIQGTSSQAAVTGTFECEHQ